MLVFTARRFRVIDVKRFVVSERRADLRVWHRQTVLHVLELLEVKRHIGA